MADHHEKTVTCASETKIFELSDFAIGHRGACLQFPEHTKISYEAASLLGAGIVECDVTFTSVGHTAACICSAGFLFDHFFF
jgi:Glycerophosphoryl diester phosphodiesterase family